MRISSMKIARNTNALILILSITAPEKIEAVVQANRVGKKKTTTITVKTN